MSSSRGAVASSSGRAKQLLVNVLFGPDLRAGKGRDAHRRLVDPSHYSHTELRQAYLERVQVLHPDRYNAHHSTVTERDQAKAQFVELQDAWSHYEKFARHLQAAGDVEASFTLFGVGCSFSDTAEERALREQITDQACRGWFSSGALEWDGDGTLDGASQTHRETTRKHPKATVRLVDDDQFVEFKEESSGFEKAGIDDRGKSNCYFPRPRSLVDMKLMRK